MSKHENWGGRRAGAGRKPKYDAALSQVVQARLSDSQVKCFKSLGGADWLRNRLDATLLQQKAQAEVPEIKPVKANTRLAVNVFDYAVQAGFPSPAESYATDALDFNDLLVDCEPATFVVRAKGDSMIEAGIAEGDLLVLDRSKEARTGDVVIMRINDEFTVKRLMKNEQGIYLHPENSSGLFSDIFPDEADEWQCVGVVTYVIKSMR